MQYVRGAPSFFENSREFRERLGAGLLSLYQLTVFCLAGGFRADDPFFAFPSRGGRRRRAAAARACERTEKLSCVSREMFHRSATFSDVTPMGIKQLCASELDATRGFIPPSHFMGLDVMVSTPAAMPTS